MKPTPKPGLRGLGAFGGLFDAGSFKVMSAPVLVASTDSVGTKTMVAGRYANVFTALNLDKVEREGSRR